MQGSVIPDHLCHISLQRLYESLERHRGKGALAEFARTERILFEDTMTAMFCRSYMLASACSLVQKYYYVCRVFFS